MLADHDPSVPTLAGLEEKAETLRVATKEYVSYFHALVAEGLEPFGASWHEGGLEYAADHDIWGEAA